MDIATLLLSVCLALLIIVAFWRFITDRVDLDGIPGPRGWPLFGYLPYLSKQPYCELYELFRKYGDVFAFRVPGYNVVVLNTYETVREAFVKQGDTFVSLPPGFTVLKWFGNYAGFNTSGIGWRDRRRFTLRTLKDFGFGRMIIEPDIQCALKLILDDVRQNNGRPSTDIQESLSRHTGNVVTKLILGKTYPPDDEFWKIVREAVGSLVMNDVMPGMEAFRPTMIIGKYLPLGLHPKFWHVIRKKKKLYQKLEEIIEEHEAAFDPNNEPTNFVDMFLTKMINAPKDSPDAEIYDREHLIPIVTTFIFGGVDTVSEVLMWVIKLLCVHQDVQRKLQEEIDEVVGTGRMPSYADSARTTYVNAVLNEVYRYSSFLPVSFYFYTAEDGVVGGHNIPEGTLLLANLYAVHRDPKRWPNPHEFDLRNVMEPDGKLKRDGLMPFFVGKRNCLGEILARMMIYLITTTLFQHYSLRLAEGETKELQIFPGMSRNLLPFKVVATPRM